MNRKPLILAIGVIFLLGFAAAIKLRQKPEQETPMTTQTHRVSVRMKWFIAGTMAPWYGAKVEEYYSNKQLEVSILSGGPDNSSIKLVAAGTDQFGVAGADEVILARSKGIPVVALAVLFKDSPICFISKQERGIKSPKDWSGKTIEVSHGDNSEIQFLALKQKFQVTGTKEVPYTFNPAPLLADKVDVSVAYRMDQALTLENQGVKLDIISAKDFGINPYADVLITSEAFLKNNAQIVRDFTESTMRAFRWIMESESNRKKAVTALVSENPALKFENELNVWRATEPFVLGGGGLNEVGRFEDQRLNETLQILINHAGVTSDFDLKRAFIQQ